MFPECILALQQAGMPSATPFGGGGGSDFDQQQQHQQPPGSGGGGGYSGMQLGDQFDAAAQVPIF